MCQKFYSRLFRIFLAIALVAFSLSVVLAGGPIKNELRHALVIGNSAYADAPLKNPANDARDMTTALEHLGFSVTTLIDADQRQMRTAIREFGRKLKAGGIGLFYYAGHGIQVRGVNYLIPVDADIEEEDEVQDYGVDVGMVLRKMQSAANRLNMVFLDACRNNPFKRSFRSSQRGLAQMDAPAGTMIAYATAPGRTAADGKGRNGIFTENLLDQLARSADVELAEFMKKVARGVQEETARQQIPWISSSVTGDFYFGGGYRSATESVSLPRTTSTPTTASRSALNAEEEFWKAIADSGNRQDYLDYLKAYPNGHFKQIALVRLRQLKSRERAPLEGEYKVSGTNPNGSRYAGMVTIRKEGRGYTVRWKVAKDTYSGRGMLKGKTLTVEWGAPSPAIYKVTPSGVLEGTWDNGKASETLTPLDGVSSPEKDAASHLTPKQDQPYTPTPAH